MNDFEFFSKVQDDEEENNQNAATTQGEEETTAPQKTASDFDFFSSIGHQEKPKEEYGALDSQRDKLQAELGDDPDVQTRAGAAFVNMMPFASTLSKENRDIRLKGLEALRSKSKMKEIDEMRRRNEKPVVPHKRSQSFLQRMLEGGAMAAGARSGMPMMSMPDGEAAPVFSGDTRARLKAHDAEVKKRMEGSAEDAYFAQLRDFAIKEAELKEAEVDKLRKESKTVDEFADKLSVAATDALTRFATAKKNAAKRLEKADLPWYKEAASGFMSNAGYTGQFIAASGLPYAGLGVLAAAGASQRFGELTTKEYDVDDDGRLVVLHNEDNGGAGTVAKAVAGGAAEVVVEQYLEKGLGLLFNGVRRIPGVGTAISKSGDAIAGAVGKVTGAIGAKMSRNAAGKWVVGAAKGFGKYSKITGVQGMPTEMLEEHVQSFADDVLGFDKKSRDQKGFGAEASDWWKNKFWNKKSNREIFLGLIGTMAVQGTYAGVKAHHDITKWRQNPAGYLKTMIDEKTVDSLSDDEVAHLFKFVSSPRFTKENVERFLGHVKDRVEMSNALLQLKEANAPFFETDGGALDEAISSGAIKSQYIPPTRSVMEGARQLDWQPYTMKDGRRTMRLYDPNTGIAIDAIGGDKNNVVVTNRDGQRFDVGSMENAMNVADRLSISNQLLDAKRPMKDAYVRKRIQEVFPGGDFVILKNAAEINKMFPDISKDRDYDPTNPAFTKDGKVYLVLDNMRNAYEVNRMILHEAAIHTGLNKKFTTDEKRDFLRNISDPETVKLMRKLGALRGKESIDDLSDADVEEAFAHVWDRRRANPLFTQKVTHALREMGRSVGLPIDYNTDDLEVMVDTLQREGRRGSGSVSPSSDFDTAGHTDSVPYNEAQRDYSGDVADIGKPSEETDDMAAIRQMQRIDRIKQNHPRMWSYAMRVNDNDEDAAADFVAKALEEEGKHGVRGESEHGMHALEVAEKLENGEDLTPDDIEILDEHGFTGPILYSDYGYRKQKNGVWKLEVIPEKPQTPKTKQEKPNETGTRTDETPVQQKQGAAWQSAAAEAARPAGSQSARTEAPGVVKEPSQASASERTVIERMTDDAPVEELPVAEVANDDSRIPNFKEGADPETGEVEPLKGEPYDLVSNPIVVMEFNDGKKVVVTGRHRLALYKRSGRGKIPARVIRERDGWTVDDAKAIDAIGNIIDEKGSVKDYVKYFDSAKPSREQAERGGFLARPKGRRAFGIYEGAGENLRSLIDWEGTGGEGLISVEQAGAIAEAAPKDAHPRNDAVQKILARKALEGVRGKKLGILARALAEEVRNRKDTLKASGEQQLDLFTSEDDLALMAAEERRAGYRAKKANEYTRIAEVLRTALRKGGKLDLNKGYAKELGITNPKDKDKLATARDRAIERANYWENSVRLDDADKSEMDAALGLSQGNAKPGLTLESSTAEEIKAEEESQRQRDAIKAGQARPLKGGSGEIGQTQFDLGDTNGDLFNPVVRNESAKPKGDFAQQITDAIDVDAKDGLIKVVPDARFGEGAHVALYAQGSESEIKAAADSLRTAFPDAKIFTDENSVVVVPAFGASQGAAKPNDDTIDLSDSLGDLGAMWFNRDLEKSAIISGDELENGNARRENGGLGGSLGYPSGFMPNRDVVDVFRAVLQETGESAKGTSMYGGGISPETAQTLFNRLNSDEDTARIFRRVFPVAQALGIEYSLSQYNGYKPGVVVLGDYERGSIRLHTNSLLRTDPQTVASTILHETIHGVTVYAMEVASGDIKNPKTKLTPELAEAAKEIFDIYKANKKWMSEDYGASDAYEMIAELANPKFRDELKKKSVWHKLWDAIKRIFGAKVSNAHDDALNALDKFVENYSKDVFDSYVKDSHRNGLDGELLGINRRFNREQDEHTDEERQAHNIVLGVKIIKNFAAKGGKDFGQFARSVKAVAPEVYGRIRNQMPGMWLNAWMGGEKALVVPQADEYEGILAATDAWNAPVRGGAAPSASAEAAQKPQEREEAAGQDKGTPKHKTRGEAISAAADEMIDLIRVDATQRKLTRKDLENVVAKHLGGSVAEGTFEMKDVTDIMELAVNRILSGDMFAPTDKPIQKIALIRNVLNKIPTQTTRSAEQDKMQQFSTVPHEAFVAAWVANITYKDVMLEPSAGIGGIAVFAKNAGAEVILNELSPRRREILEQLGLSPKVYGFNAEHLWAQFYSPVKKGEVKRPTVVVMNPPFSNSALTSKKDTVGVGGKHIEEALEMLAPGGRLVAIVGHGMAHDADSPKVKAWWKKIGAKYRVRADVTVNGDEYAKYGTTYDNDILVIDKVAPDATIAPIFGKIQSIDELPAMLEGVRNDRPAIQSENVAPKPDNGGPVKGTPGRGNGGNHLQSGNGGNGSDKPRGKPAGRADGRVPGAKEDGGRGHSSGTGLGVGSTVPDGAGLTEVRTAQGDSGEASPRELGDGTFSAYRPAKVRIEGAKPHPTALVESTAMASVLPPDPTYSPILPKKAIESGMPSDAQLEQIVYAGQAHEQKLPDGRRKGYFFGDGTGLGKGTEIGGVISDNWNHGRRKAVWVSKKPQLINDAMRDLVTYGLDGQIFDFNPKKKSVMGRDTGIAFLSYDGLKQDCVFDTEGKVRSAKQGQRNRFQQLVEWLGKDFDGVIVFDEAHKAGNAVPTRGSRGAKPASKQALAVVALQDALPNARILYVSATGATEVSNLSYATRLGLWGKGTAFRDRADFINRVSAGGLSVMEIVARDMKSMGVYMARSLSYDGIVNRKLEHSLSPDQKRKYDEMADAWQMVMARVGDALVTTGGVGNGNAVSAVMSALWGGQQRFFNQLLTAMQMPSVIADAKKQLDEGNSVVFQLINTNEATQKRAIEAQRRQNGEVNADELDLSPRDILVGFVRNSFPVVKYVEQEDDEGNKEWVVLTGPDGQPVEDPIALEARQELLDKLNMMKLDDNPLELIIEEFGAENVAEITGRSQRRQMVRNDDGEMEMKLVRRSDKICFTEAGEFNDGKRRVLVFSDSGGTGFSFHADKRFGNQQKRIHYLVQAGWRADAALQGFGRTHRSNEAQPPEYVLCSTDIRGHQRFISTVARRLAQLGSLTAGDRASAGSGVFSDEDNLENQYAENAVKDLFHSIHHEDFGRFNTICKQLGFVKMKLDKRTGDVNEVNDLIDPEDGTINDEKLSIQKFLNRILNCRVDVQNRLFDEFAEIMHDHIEQAKENGTFDPGLERLQGHKIEETSRTELWSGGKGTGSTDIVEIGVSNRTRKVDYETVLARMQRQAEGRNWFFARNTNSGKLFGFAETPRAKTLPSGLVVNQLRCYTPDGKAPLVLETDVRFDGDHANFEMVSEKDAAEEWGKALAAIPDMNTTKRYFVSGTLLPIWDRLAVQNPRIFRVAPTGEKASFLGMEIKAENVNDILRRFGKAAQSIELTPEAVLNRIVQDGKKVPLVQTGWELKRARVNGDYRIELVGPEDKKTLEKLARDGLGTYERIGYVPRFFVPRTADGLSRFLSEYPAMPEDGGISTVAGSGADYSALDYEQRQSKFTELFNGYQNALSGNGGHAENVKAHDALDGLIAAMPTEELTNIVEEWQQYDTRRAADPVHVMRKMVRIELQKRGAIDDKWITELGLWFNRDIDALTDPLSSVAIHEVNEWRKARGLPEMPKSKRTSVEKIVKAGKYMASNADEMRRFIEVSARTPQNWTAVEVNAVAQRRIVLEQDYDEKTRLINVAEMNGNKDEAQRIREARDLVQDQIDLMDSAINKAKREWGLAGLARRFMLNRDGTFARFTGEMRSIVGRELTDEEKQGAWTLWNAYRDAQGKLDEVTVTKTAELLKDIVAKHMAAEEERHRKGDGKSLAEIEREYLYALDHIRVHANRAGGVLVGLPNGRKWLDAIRRYHMALAIETGRKLTVDEMLAAIHEDIDGMVVADDHDIMQMTTGHGNTYEADDSELEKALREQRRLMNEYQKWEDMMEEGHLPDKTGLIRDEPTQAEREAQRTTREMMREFMQQHPELLAMDASKRLKTIQDSLMKRWQNEIDDLQRAIEDGERIMRQKNTMTYTPEMEAKRRELEQKRQEYREAFPPEPLTHEQKVARIMRALQARLAKLEEKRDALTNAGMDAEREALLSKAKIDKVEDIRLDDLRNQIDEVKEDIEDLKTMHFPEGTPEEFTAMVARRRKALDKNIQRIQILLANRDFAPQKREPSALAKRVATDPEIQALVKTRNAASKRLMEERERFRRSVLPYNAGRVLDWFNVLTSAPRVLRTMLDLSATMTQGAALFTSHPLMGYRALVDSVKAFASEKNTDDIMAAMEADPDYAEFQLVGGHVYTVSDISERGVPEEFRGIATKLVKVNGKEYGLDDIPGVKASERSFGVFLNSINLSVYKAIKASGGWGPTGPTDTQKKDIALSLNVASGRGYENKGARGIWERIASAALWAPRFAISGAKMAIGWNIVAPHFTGLTTERSYKDRWVSSKVAAQQYVRQMASMAAWTLLGTLLMGRKDPEWLEEVLDPRSSNFLNVRIGNTNVNFFGPIKQWWTFMARLLTGQTRGADGMVRNRSQMQTATTFVRGKLSPLAGLGVDLLNQKNFLGNKIVWGKEVGRKEVSGWKHVAESLALPLSSSDLIDAFKENSLANALMLTPFIVAGAGKSTYALDEYARVVSPYKAALKEYKAAMKEGRWADSKQILADNPALKRSASIDNLLKNVAMTKKYIENLEKAGKKPSEDLLSRYERQQQAVMEAIRK